MYQLLREEARQAGTPMGHDAFQKSYIRFVDLIHAIRDELVHSHYQNLFSVSSVPLW